MIEVSCRDLIYTGPCNIKKEEKIQERINVILRNKMKISKDLECKKTFENFCKSTGSKYDSEKIFAFFDKVLESVDTKNYRM